MLVLRWVMEEGEGMRGQGSVTVKIELQLTAVIADTDFSNGDGATYV